MKLAFTLLTLACAASVAFAAADIGKPAPDFTAKDINGKTHKLSDYKGKIVVLESYNMDCPFCANHFKTGAMQELQSELAAKGVIWLMVNSVNAKNPSHRTPEALSFRNTAKRTYRLERALRGSYRRVRGGSDRRACERPECAGAVLAPA